MKIKTTKDRRKRISLRQRKRINGTAERPRLRVFRSVSHIYAQVISGCGSRVLAAASTVEPAVRAQVVNGGNKAAAAVVGKLIAERARAAGIEQVAFDRSGFLFHGRVKALAEAAREGGLKF